MHKQLGKLHYALLGCTAITVHEVDALHVCTTLHKLRKLYKETFGLQEVGL